MTGRTRRQFLAVTGVTLAAALATNPARAQLTGQGVTTRLPSKVGVAPGYIVSGRGEHSSNPYFVPQGKPSTLRHDGPMGLARRTLRNHDSESGQSFRLLDGAAGCLLPNGSAQTIFSRYLCRLDLRRTATQRLLGRRVRHHDTGHLGV